MKRTVLSMTLGLLASLVFGGTALALEQVDQRNIRLEQVGASGVVADRPMSGYSYRAQSFKANKTGELSKVSLPIARGACLANSQEDLLVVKIYSITATGWVMLSSTAVSETQMPQRTNCEEEFALPAWTDITFPSDSRANVAAGSDYAVALEAAPSQDNDAFFWFYNYGNHYLRGTSYYLQANTAGWTLLSPDVDFMFRTYVDVDDTTAPTGSIQINDGAASTADRTVTLDLRAKDDFGGSGVTEMRIRNENKTWVETPWQPKTATKDWTLSAFPGQKTVYVRYRDAAGNVSPTYSDAIIYRQ